MKKQTGITLIALIITIIVMLILVGVTINVALNGGLIEKAKTAGEQTQRETDKEQLLSAVIATVDNNGDFHLDQIELPDGFEKTPEGRYKNTETGKEYTVDTKTGKVTEVTNSNSGNAEGTEETYSFTINGLGLEPSYGVDGVVLIYSLSDFKAEVGKEPFIEEGYILQPYGLYNIVSNNEKIGSTISILPNGSKTGNEEMFVGGMVQNSNFVLSFFDDEGDGLHWSSVVNQEKFIEDYGDTVFTFVKN